jgi:hypothetical protein
VQHSYVQDKHAEECIVKMKDRTHLGIGADRDQLGSPAAARCGLRVWDYSAIINLDQQPSTPSGKRRIAEAEGELLRARATASEAKGLQSPVLRLEQALERKRAELKRLKLRRSGPPLDKLQRAIIERNIAELVYLLARETTKTRASREAVLWAMAAQRAHKLAIVFDDYPDDPTEEEHQAVVGDSEETVARAELARAMDAHDRAAARTSAEPHLVAKLKVLRDERRRLQRQRRRPKAAHQLVAIKVKIAEVVYALAILRASKKLSVALPLNRWRVAAARRLEGAITVQDNPEGEQ